MKTAAAFKQSDVTRAIRGAKSAGLDVTNITISQAGEIKLALKEPNASDRKDGSEWDEVLE